MRGGARAAPARYIWQIPNKDLAARRRVARDPLISPFVLWVSLVFLSGVRALCAARGAGGAGSGGGRGRRLVEARARARDTRGRMWFSLDSRWDTVSETRPPIW